jgi:hypothetical protein
MMVGIIMIVIWFNYELLVNNQMRWDLALIAGVMALTKILAMVLLRITN